MTQKQEWLEACKNRGMQDGELLLATCEELALEFYPEASDDDVEACHARAAAYCIGEAIANWWETPERERPLMQDFIKQYGLEFPIPY